MKGRCLDTLQGGCRALGGVRVRGWIPLPQLLGQPRTRCGEHAGARERGWELPPACCRLPATSFRAEPEREPPRPPTPSALQPLPC